nr:uncharacterized protein LOC111427231 [Onthophagus taurus]
MSSDNDSDSCELFTKFSKIVENSEDKFWSNFSLKKDDASVELDTSQNCNPKEAQILDEPVVTIEDETAIAPTASIESSETLLTRINSLLDNMQEKVTDALNQPVRARGGKRKKAVKSRRSNRINKTSVQIPEPVLLSDEDDKVNNEVKQITIDINPVIHIKVLWRIFETHTFKLKKFQKLTPIRDYFVKTKNAKPELLFFTLDDKEIDLDCNCYASLRLTEYKSLEGCLLPDSYLNQPKQEIIDLNKYDFQFKVQTGVHREKSFYVKCKKGDKTEVIFWQVILKTGKPIEEIKLSFDGELLKPDQELLDLDIMDGDCIDLI